MKAGLFIATAALYAIACILYLIRLTRGSEKAPRAPGTVFVAALGAHLAEHFGLEHRFLDLDNPV